MNRRTFVKLAAGTPALAAAGSIETPKGTRNTWPETVSLDNPIGHPFPVKFVEEVPLLLRGYNYGSSFDKEPELFRFTAHEWVSDAILFRGIEIKPKPGGDPARLSNRELLDTKLNLYIDDCKVLDRWSIGAFMKDGGGAFPLHGCDPRKALVQTFRGWVDKDGFPDPDHFLGYFLPNKACVVAKIEAHKGSFAIEVKCDIARYRYTTRRT